jgi:glycosyltransferase involved in cell wall biosynthesis
MILKNNRVVIIDPICIGRSGIEEYTEGLFKGLINNKVDVYLFSHYRCGIKNKRVYKFFLFFSERLKDGIIRKLIRALEYFLQSLFSILILLKIKPKVIHYNWLIFYPFDIIILSIIKKIMPNVKLIYTAHNVIPHNLNYNNKRLLNLYLSFDKIIVHGQNLKDKLLFEFKTIESNKIYSSFHGKKRKLQQTNFNTNLSNGMTLENNKYILFVGLINKNKGVDFLLKCWKRISNKNNYKLIIAGKVNENYQSFWDELKNEDDSIIIINEFLNTDDFNKLINYSKLILLPYVNGSVSGVLFSAAQFKKPVLSTNFGSINEYIINNSTSFISSSNDDFEKKLQIILCFDVKKLNDYGIKNHEFISANFNWNVITKNLKTKCYEIL